MENISQSQFELEALMSRQPYQGSYPSFLEYERQVKAFHVKLRKWGEDHPEHKGKVTFSPTCVPCNGLNNVGECLKCKGFDPKKNHADLSNTSKIK